MCGICGFTEDQPLGPDAELLVVAMRDAMSHRGPDGAAVRPGPDYALGHRRPKIMDFSEHAAQSRPNQDETVWVTFNGEISNRSDVDRLYHACDETALTKRCEGTLNVVLDPMASAVPLVATDAADNALILEAASGRGVVPLDDDAAAEGVCHMVSDVQVFRARREGTPGGRGSLLPRPVGVDHRRTLRGSPGADETEAPIVGSKRWECHA